MLASEVIREGRNVLFEDGWTRCVWNGQDNGLPRCAEGALIVGAERLGRRSGFQAAKALFDSMLQEDRAEREPGTYMPSFLWAWNDQRTRTFDEVVDLFDRAEKRALIAEESDG